MRMKVEGEVIKTQTVKGVDEILATITKAFQERKEANPVWAKTITGILAHISTSKGDAYVIELRVR